MAQRYVEERGRKKLLIEASVRCNNHPAGRIVRKRRLDDLELGSSKANAIEKQLFKEVEKERTERDLLGVNWETLLNLYEAETYDKVLKGEHPQNPQTFDEALKALRKWTKDWFPELAARLTCNDVTRLFHEIKEDGCSDSFIGKVRADLKKVFDFGIVFRHIKGMDQSPTVGVTIKSRRRMRV
ncbi:MAG: hypothetical protein K2X47_08420, partial [Bdellovibrionales bacterium]|nr:hypothetical protein [Bdellovibrionales bacterium]